MRTSAQAKVEVRRLLESPDFVSALAEAEQRLSGQPDKSLTRPILSALCSADAQRRHRAAALLGVVVGAMARRDLEEGRDVLRRLLWSLNEESGTMGWGAPEAMAEIMAANLELAREFARLLAALATPELNPLDNPDLLGSVVWGLGRLARAQPYLAEELDLAPALLPWLESQEPRLRGMAAWAVGQAGLRQGQAALLELQRDSRRIGVFVNGRLGEASIGELAQRSMAALAKPPIC